MPSTTPNQSRPFAVITGASSGIGYELAKVFAKNGYDLLIAAEDVGIMDASNTLRALGGSVDHVQTDLSTFEGVDKLNTMIRAAGRGIDVVVMNAGVGVGGEFVETDLQRELKLVRLNIDSLIHLSKHVLPVMIAQGQGKILFTSSIAATMPGPYYAVYAASKAFVQSFAEALRQEVKDKGVVITSLQPGPTDTNFFERADMVDTAAGQGPKDDPAQVAQDGFDALMAGKDHVVAGKFMNKAQAVLGKLASEPMGAKMQGKQTKPLDK